MYSTVGSMTVAAGFPKGKQPEFPMGEIPLGQYSCKKLLKKKKIKSINTAQPTMLPDARHGSKKQSWEWGSGVTIKSWRRQWTLFGWVGFRFWQWDQNNVNDGFCSLTYCPSVLGCCPSQLEFCPLGFCHWDSDHWDVIHPYLENSMPRICLHWTWSTNYISAWCGLFANF